jgi:hypothetical protein
MNIYKFCKTYDNNYITKNNYLTTCVTNNSPSNDNSNNGVCKYIDNSNNIQSTNIKCNLNILKPNETEINKYKSISKNTNYISNLTNVNIPLYVDKINLVKLKPTNELLQKIARENNISVDEVIINFNYYMSNIDLSYNSILYDDNISGFEKQKYIDEFNKLFIIEPLEENNNNILLYIIIFIIIIIGAIIIIKYYNN